MADIAARAIGDSRGSSSWKNLERCPSERKNEPLSIHKTGEIRASNSQGGWVHELYPAVSFPALLLPAPYLLEASGLNSEQPLLDPAG